MIQHLTGYRISELIYQSTLSRIYKGAILSNDTPVIIKILSREYPTNDELARYKREYRIVSSIRGEGIVRSLGSEKAGNSVALIFEDMGGISLQEVINQQHPDLGTKLTIAIGVTDALIQIHQQAIIHKDINPGNIIWNPGTDKINMIDFGIASELTRENPDICNPNILEGTLAYVSPEQTGRMNCSMDYRTDLYSLGITLYELFCGQLPFSASDAMGMVHCHIAVVPPEPHEIDSHIPRPVSDIIMKLIEKSPDKRYQSALGLKKDLSTCLTQWNEQKDIRSFSIAQSDISLQFRIPQKLYGREHEIETLLDAFSRAGSGNKEVMLVAGYSGVGKSSLIHEVNRPIVEKRGLFIWGKFDQYKRNIPYLALIQAFKRLVNNMLAEDDAQLKIWKKRIIQALGPSAQVVIDVIPEVEFIIGKQPPVQELDPDQAKNRFNIVFQNFLRVFARKECPLVLFMDDLQWADLPTLQLIKEFMADLGTRYFLVIGAYRDNEVDAAHILMTLVEELKKNDLMVNTMTLAPLDLSQVNQMVSDVLVCEPHVSIPLSMFCHEKTMGNPFSLGQLITSLYEEGYITFNQELEYWECDEKQINQVYITDNVVDLMVSKIRKLPEKTQHTLTMASCIGNQFDLHTLGLVCDMGKIDVARILFETLQEHLIVPVDDAYKYILENEENLNATYRFVHDRIQQAAYTLIHDEQKKAVHLQIGRALAEKMDMDDPDETVFSIVNHLYLGMDLIQDIEEQVHLARLSLVAGKKAKHSAAYLPACDYVNTGINILGETGWENHYTLTLNLHNEAVESLYLSGLFADSETVFNRIINHAKTPEDKVRAYEIRILTLISESRFKDAMETGLVILHMLGVTFPKKPTMLHIILGLIKLKLALRGTTDETFLTLPPMENPMALSRASILHKLGSTTLFSNPELYPLTIFRRMSLSLYYGHDPLFSISSYASFGLILCSIGKIDEGYRYGMLAIKVLEASSIKKEKTRVLVLFNMFIRHWKEPLRTTVSQLLEGYESRIETGDIEYASHCMSAYCLYMFLAGLPLKQVEAEQGNYLKSIRLLRQKFDLDNIGNFHQMVLNLMNPDGDLKTYSGTSFNEETMIPVLIEEGNKTALFAVFLFKANLLFFGGNIREAMEYATQARQYLDSVRSLFVVPAFIFYEALIMLAMSRLDSVDNKRSLIKKAGKNLKKIQLWSCHSPANHLHKWHLVKAEIMDCLNRKEDARALYIEAIRRAKESEYIQEEALACELFAAFLIRHDEQDFAGLMIKKSVYLYAQWGAAAKVAQMKKNFGNYPGMDIPMLNGHKTSTHAVNYSEKITTSDSLDMSSIMKASRAISREIELPKLLEKVLDISMENAGAQRSAIILEEKGILFVEAESRLGRDDHGVVQSISLEQHKKLPHSIIQYVYRTNNMLILDDPASEGEFTDDAYIMECKPKSILCGVFLSQGKMVAIIYLENNVSTGAFQVERMELLASLASQVAISIHNARLYENLEEKVNERTKELNVTLKEMKKANDHIMESLRYSRIIQQSLLPDREKIKAFLPDSFFVWQPRDIVGGDIYYCEKFDHGILLALIDCTGHGIPGAFMTMLASSGLQRIVTEDRVSDPATILSRLNYLIKTSLNQNTVNSKSDDGLDASICFFDYNTRQLIFSGAHQHLYVVEDGKIDVIKGDRHSIGYVSSDLAYTFRTHMIPKADQNKVFYMTTDGYIDQLGGERHNRLGSKRFKKLILKYYSLDFKEQKRILLKELMNHKLDEPLTDDVTLAGFRIFD